MVIKSKLSTVFILLSLIFLALFLLLLLIRGSYLPTEKENALTYEGTVKECNEKIDWVSLFLYSSTRFNPSSSVEIVLENGESYTVDKVIADAADKYRLLTLEEKAVTLLLHEDSGSVAEIRTEDTTILDFDFSMQQFRQHRSSLLILSFGALLIGMIFSVGAVVVFIKEKRQ